MCHLGPHSSELSQIPPVERWFWEGLGFISNSPFPPCLVSQDSPDPRGEDA